MKAEPPNIRKRPNKQSVIGEGTGSKEENKRQEIVLREFLKIMEKACDRKMFAQRQRANWHPSVFP